MGLPKGKTNNPKGRKIGSLNKTTTEIKEIMVQFIGDNIGNIQSEFDKLEAKEKLFFFEKILKYIIPINNELKSISENIPIVTVTQIEFRADQER